MVAQKFNFAPKFIQNGGFLAPNFVFLTRVADLNQCDLNH